MSKNVEKLKNGNHARGATKRENIYKDTQRKEKREKVEEESKNRTQKAAGGGLLAVGCWLIHNADCWLILKLTGSRRVLRQQHPVLRENFGG